MVFVLLDALTSTLNLPSNFKLFRPIDKEVYELCNQFKGHDTLCHVFCKRRFQGKLQIPVTRVLGGNHFNVVFEACVANY